MNENPLDSMELRGLATRLREAREARGWTQQQVAERLGMARTTIVAIEKGERRIKPQELIDLAALFGRHVSELLQKKTPTASFVTQLRADLPSSVPGDGDLVPFLEDFQLRCEDYARIEELCQAPQKRHYPPEYGIQGESAELAAEDVAATERSRLDLGEGPLVNLREILDTDVGIRVFQLELPSEVTGIYAYAESLEAVSR